jgi:formate dehydrogenase subunit gamma
MTLREEVAKIIADHRELEGPLLPVLHAVQQRFGHIPAAAEGDIAAALNLSAAEVRGVISFYNDFRSSPAGRHSLKICCAEACQARGARALVSHAVDALGIEFGTTTVDGLITLDKVYCLGNCACGPSLSVNGEVYAQVDAPRFDELMADLHGEHQG